LDVRDELVGDLRQRDLGDVELVLGDQLQEQVERALEVVEAHLEPRRGVAGRGLLPCFLLGRHSSVNRRTSALASPWASKSASTIAMASRTSRPRSTASPCERRSTSRACSRSSSSSEVT